MLGSLILYLKGMRIMMFQLSGFYYKAFMISGSLQSELSDFWGSRQGEFRL